MSIQQAFEHINQKVFKTINIADISTTEIIDLKNTYPCFILGRYLFSYKKKESFHSINLEASLHPDPLWFGYVIENIQNHTAISKLSTSLTENYSTPKILNEKIKIPADIPSNNSKKENQNTKILPLEPTATTLPISIPSVPFMIDEYILLPMLDLEYPLSVNTYIVENTLKNPDHVETSKKNKVTEKNTTNSFLPLYVEDYFSAVKVDEKETIHNTTISSIKTASKNQKPFIDWLEEFSTAYKTTTQSINSSEKNNTPVASETMAEIWIAEKRYDKAISTYEKLSLLFPKKSVYFAEKISELRNTLK